MLGEGGVIVGGQLGPEGRVVLGTDGARPTRAGLGLEVVGVGQADVALDRIRADAEACGDVVGMLLLVDDRSHDAVAEIQRVRFHSERLPNS